MSNYFKFGLSMLCFMLLMVHGALAQEPADDSLFSFGTVVSVSPQRIVLKEYDFEREEQMKVTYVINSQTQFENVQAASEIKTDDELEVYYKESNKEKVATVIAKYEVLEEDLEDGSSSYNQEIRDED